MQANIVRSWAGLVTSREWKPYVISRRGVQLVPGHWSDLDIPTGWLVTPPVTYNCVMPILGELSLQRRFQGGLHWHLQPVFGAVKKHGSLKSWFMSYTSPVCSSGSHGSPVRVPEAGRLSHFYHTSADLLLPSVCCIFDPL